MSDITTWIMSVATAFFPGFGDQGPPVYAGYVEAEYVYVSPTATRRIANLVVEEGDQVDDGQFLFELDDTRETAALRAAIARRDVAAAELHNLETGSRSAEIEVIRAALAQARADQILAESNLERSQSLFDRDIVTKARVDNERAALDRANARIEELQAKLEVAELPARDAQIVAATAALSAAEAEMDQTRAALSDLKVSAPATGRIEKVYFDLGEVAPAGTPVLSILPPGALKILFYIPETERLNFTIGQSLALTCDGCQDDLTVTITRMASDPQYTPPIIYSRDERARLVYRAEGRLHGDAALLPGQPVTLERLQ